MFGKGSYTQVQKKWVYETFKSEIQSSVHCVWGNNKKKCIWILWGWQKWVYLPFSSCNISNTLRKYSILWFLNLGCSICPNTLWRNLQSLERLCKMPSFPLKQTYSLRMPSLSCELCRVILRSVFLWSALFQRLSTMLCFARVLCMWGICGNRNTSQ